MITPRYTKKFIGSKLNLLFLALLFHLLTVLFYVQNVTPVFGYAGMTFSYARILELALILIISMSIIVFSMPSTVKVSNLFALVVYIFVTNSIFVVSIHFNKIDQIYQYIFSITLSMLIVNTLSKFNLIIKLKGSHLFEYIVATFYVICLATMLDQARISGIRLAGIDEIYSLRENLNTTTLARYGISIFMFAIGPLMIAIGFNRKRYIWIYLAFFAYLLGYMLTFQKSIILAPFWITGLFLVIRSGNISNSRIFLYLITPFIIALAVSLFKFDFQFVISAILGTRMYIIPGQVFAHYVDFFSHFEHTYFSHIKIFSSFIDYPYNLQLPQLIKNYYPGGNQNANFFAQDAIAGAGIWAMPIVGAVFAFVIMIINTATRGLDLRFSLIACTMAAQRFADGSLATGLLSGGVILLIILLALAPRQHYGPSEPDTQLS